MSDNVLWGQQPPRRGPVPVREEIATGPCRTKSKLLEIIANYFFDKLAVFPSLWRIL